MGSLPPPAPRGVGLFGQPDAEPDRLALNYWMKSLGATAIFSLQPRVIPEDIDGDIPVQNGESSARISVFSYRVVAWRGRPPPVSAYP
jgi:hypothetical protein